VSLLKRGPASSLLFGLFVVGMLIVSILGIRAGFQVGDSQGQQRVVIAVVVVAIGILVVAGSMFGLLARSNSRNEALQNRFLKATVATIRKTRDLETQLLILNGQTSATGVGSDALGYYYSSLVIDESGVAVWTGGARDLTRTLFFPSDRVKEVGVLRSSSGSFLSLVVDKGSVPVQLRIPVVHLGKVGFYSPKDDDVRRLADQARLKLGVQEKR
jgi:hypothetical protein